MNQNNTIHITIVYDNKSYLENLQSDWGFSCFIRGLEKAILFDTGGSSQILLDNMEKLRIEPGDIDEIFLSHDHKDHTGGVEALLKRNREIGVWVPNFFPSGFKASLRKHSATVIEAKGFEKICAGAYTTGVINGWIKEQSLILESAEGSTLITGCAHPRIVNIVRKAKNLLKQDIHTILGGFHLAGFEDNIIQEIIDTLQDEGVTKVGPCHCSGTEAQRLFAQTFGENYLELGVGKKIIIQ